MDLAFLCVSGVAVAGHPFGHLCAGVNCGEMDSYPLTLVLLPFPLLSELAGTDHVYGCHLVATTCSGLHSEHLLHR